MTATRAYIRAGRYFRHDLGKIVFSTLLIGLTTIAGLAQPFPLAILIDFVLNHQKGGAWPHRLFQRCGPQGVISQIVQLAVITLLLRLFPELIGLWQRYFKILTR